MNFTAFRVGNIQAIIQAFVQKKICRGRHRIFNVFASKHLYPNISLRIKKCGESPWARKPKSKTTPNPASKRFFGEFVNQISIIRYAEDIP